MLLTDLDKRIIREIQKDLPITPRPFSDIAKKIGISEENLLNKIQDFLDNGYIRRFGATLRHRKVGINANAMSVWAVPNNDIERIGKIMASFKEVTHCYERYPMPDSEYNLFTMIHAKTREECLDIVERISDTTGIKNYKLLFSTEEFKKTSMEYF
jgi:siroheme decarboxylase